MGLVQHLAVDVERFWFRVVVAGETTVEDESDSSESAWAVSPETRVADVFDLYRKEIGLANDIIANAALDAEPKYWPDFFGDWHLPDLRSILLHVIAETACHSGHLDTAPRTDGRPHLAHPHLDRSSSPRALTGEVALVE